MERTVPEISVIMPAHNAADFIDFSIQNLVDHQFGTTNADRWELIIVDDGSTDSTPEISRQWQQRYPESIKLIRSENRGVSAARNLGLSAARGKYVYFIDSDDILLRNSLMPLCLEADHRQADIVKFTCREIDTPTYMEMQANVASADLTPEDFYEYSATEFVVNTNGLSGPPQHHNTVSSLYLRQFLEEHSFGFNPALSIGEDLILTWQALLVKPRILYADRALYQYHQHGNSAMHISDPSKLAAAGRAYIDYIKEMLQIERTLASTEMNTPQVRQGLADIFRFGYNRALCLMILGDESLLNIFRTMRSIKSLGGDVHPGRPRFDKQHRRNIPRRYKIRRWIVAYLIAPVCYL